jgi:hypothetical protein
LSARFLIAAVVAVSVAGAASWLLGSGAAPDAEEATAAAEQARGESYAAELPAAEASGRSKGREAGLRAGKRQGASEGREEGEATAVKAVAEAREAAAEASAPPSTDPFDYPLGGPAPTPVGTSCPAPYSYHMGICKIARPALPEECPPGWVPAGLSGACAPGRP